MTKPMTKRGLFNLKPRAAELWVACLLMVILGGCRSTPPFGQPEADKSQAVVKLRSGLVINIVVLVAGEKEIDEPAKRISENGTIVLPLLGQMSVTDLGLDDLRDRLTKRYQAYYIRPQVMVDFARDTKQEGISPWGFVTVLGRVKDPGRIVIPATRDLTVSGAIQQAGGFATSAKDNAILVTRVLPNGKTESRTINLKAVGTAGRLDDDIVLEADDVVFVPEAMF
ncbi:MAG: polysaccharide biosynthesis/export family protein [Kiritimatiellia bacterium]|nr:polysaccharide biosynthesis/export family protein [Kiritimatiellia bacterium]